MTVETRLPTPLETAARAYVSARMEHEDADRYEWVRTNWQMSAALHDLIVAAGYECRMCDDGSCPGSINDSSAAPSEILEVGERK